MLLHNSAFWLSEVGLMLTFISCTLLAYRFRQNSLVMIPLWIVTIATIMLFVHPLQYAAILGSPLYSALIFLISLSTGGAGWYYSWLGKQPGTSQEQLTSQKVFTWSAVFSGLLLSYVIWKLKQSGR
ncbi:hypothetical protein GCM10028805_47530 [Spirosoma harenae]